MPLHLDVDWNGHGFEIYAAHTKHRKHPWRRVAWRNSAIRQQCAGRCHYERWWFRGWDISLQWGQFDPTKPAQFYHPKEGKWLPRGA